MRHLTICCAFGLFASGVALADEPFFMGLGDLPGGPFASRGLGISADGSTVVGQSAYQRLTHWYPYQAFRWTRQTGMVGLGGSTPSKAIEAWGAVG